MQLQRSTKNRSTYAEVMHECRVAGFFDLQCMTNLFIRRCATCNICRMLLFLQRAKRSKTLEHDVENEHLFDV